MTMFLAPYTAIADVDGSPLDAGFLYLGEYGKDPEMFPVEVFWDADFTIPAAQPIRTRNGYPVRNGSPTKVYLKTAQHSIVIKNRNGAFVLVDFYNKGWDASFVVDGDNTQKQINNIALDPNLAPLGWTQKDFNDQFVDVRKFVKKDLSNATTGLQAAIEEAYGGTLLIPIPLVLLDSMYVEKGLNILGTQSAVTSYASDTKRLDFSALGANKNAFNIAKNGQIIGFSMQNINLRGGKNGGAGIDTGAGIGSSLVDFMFTNMVLSNFSQGVRQTYSWSGEFNRVRVQGCTNGIEYNSQCNAIQHNATSVVTIDDFALKHSNAEGIQYNSCNISNLKKTNGAPISFFQSTATFVNPYLENIDGDTSMQVGTAGEVETLPSSIIIVSPKKLGKKIVTASHLNHVEILGFDKDNVSVVGSQLNRETKAIVSGSNAISKINRVLDRLECGKIRAFQASGSAALSYATKRGFFEISNSAATSGIRLASNLLTIGKTYTLSIAARKGSGNTYATMQGQGTALAFPILDAAEEVRIQNFTFIATTANLNLWFDGTIEFYGFQIQEGNLATFEAPFQLVSSRQTGVFEALSEPTGVTNWVIGDKIINKGSGDVLHWEATSATALKAISKIAGLTSTSTSAQIVAAMQAAGIAT